MMSDRSRLAFKGYNGRQSCWDGDEKGKKSKFTSTLIGKHKNGRLSFSPRASSALAMMRNSSYPNFYQEVLEVAREKFTQEISFQSKDKDISLAKKGHFQYVALRLGLLPSRIYSVRVPVWGLAFMAFNREKDARSLQSERRDTSVKSNAQEYGLVEAMPLAGKSIREWLIELDTIAEEVKAELVSRDIGCHLVEVLEAVNLVLFKSRDTVCFCSYRLAIMASERLLILQPHNWALRGDHGMMLYYSREYEAAVQELSICMAFAPEEEAGI
ncbi:hypothetical protein RHSIM_Rhsim11G0035700 [Rhododendron simsii]|uniref:Uncharacterized protein n=1 Tax=Rhododendron simsii TaxID=118357 RepID=A0A834G4C8_RHOSS|nr:hypothetical protein RHSIM_Rhsim11G0035700 [Rhododendron simsii]